MMYLQIVQYQNAYSMLVCTCSGYTCTYNITFDFVLNDNRQFKGIKNNKGIYI